MTVTPSIPRFDLAERPAVTGGPLRPVVMDGRIAESAGKYARGAVLYAFEAIGGAEALAGWAKDNENDFYTKLFPKIITKEVEVTDKRGVDELLDALDGDYEVVQGEGVGAETAPGQPTSSQGWTGAVPPHAELSPAPLPAEREGVSWEPDVDDLTEFRDE